jgi:hypothetical protein
MTVICGNTDTNNPPLFYHPGKFKINFLPGRVSKQCLLFLTAAEVRPFFPAYFNPILLCPGKRQGATNTK